MEVFRCTKQKWFAHVMKITYKNLGMSNDKKVFVVNLKAAPERVADLADKKTIFPAYHMNKKHWITVLLTSATDFDLLRSLTEQSRVLVLRTIFVTRFLVLRTIFRSLANRFCSGWNELAGRRADQGLQRVGRIGIA